MRPIKSDLIFLMTLVFSCLYLIIALSLFFIAIRNLLHLKTGLSGTADKCREKTLPQHQSTYQRSPESSQLQCVTIKINYEYHLIIRKYIGTLYLLTMTQICLLSSQLYKQFITFWNVSKGTEMFINFKSKNNTFIERLSNRFIKVG